MRSGSSGGPGGSCQRLVMAGFRMCAGGLMYRPSGPFVAAAPGNRETHSTTARVKIWCGRGLHSQPS